MAAGPPGDPRPAPVADHPSSAGPSRRGVLVTAGVLAAAAAVMGGAGRWIGKYRARLTDIAFPKPADPAPAFPTGIEADYPGITPLRVPTDEFYRVDTRLDVPIVDIDGWSLKIDGMVDKELELTFDDLLAMPLIERDITLTCVSNSVGGPYVGGARWIGVRLTDLLELAGVQDGVDQIFSTDVDGMTIGTPYELATDGRDAMIALGMNGAALPREHGYPARMVVPGLYGFISACKWIERITLTTYAAKDSYWTKRDWATNAPDQDLQPDRHPQGARDHRRRRHLHRRHRLGAAERRRRRRCRSRSTAVPGRTPCSAPAPATTTGGSGTSPGGPSPAPTTSPAGSSTATATPSPPPAMDPFPEGSSGIQQLIVKVA